MLVLVMHIETVHLRGQRVNRVLVVAIRRGLAVDRRSLQGMRRLLCRLIGLVGLDGRANGTWCWRRHKLCGRRVIFLG